jgi:hypothetical protein
MTLPPEMPAYRRAAIIIVLLIILVFVAALRGAAPVAKKWFGDWQQSAR